MKISHSGKIAGHADWILTMKVLWPFKVFSPSAVHINTYLILLVISSVSGAIMCYCVPKKKALCCKTNTAAFRWSINFMELGNFAKANFWWNTSLPTNFGELFWGVEIHTLIVLFVFKQMFVATSLFCTMRCADQIPWHCYLWCCSMCLCSCIAPFSALSTLFTELALWADSV